MADTTYVDSTTLLTANTMNDLNRLHYTILGDPADAAAIESKLNTKTTVASGATPDIFAITVGRLIDYTGTATCTGFVAAPQAGMFRELYCAGACLFTAGANLLIEGIPSGTTITLAAGALVQVRAITTTQFKMTYSVSGTFTATGTGFSVAPTVTASYTVVNGIVHISIPTGSMTGTSTLIEFNITGLPACLGTSQQVFPIMDGLNNSIACHIYGYVLDYTNTYISLFSEHSSGSFTAAGTKRLFSSEFTYHIK